jgi:hypothetical protein
VVARKKLQVVVQLAGDYFASHEDLVAFEDRLRAALPRTHELEGHDTGSGTTNFFIETNSPLALQGSTFTNLWPRRDPRPFSYSYPDGEDPFAPASKRVIPKRSPRGSRAR